MEDDNRDNRVHSGTFRGSKISAEFPSPSRTPDIFRRGIRRASSNLHEAKVKSNDNIPCTKGNLLPKYFSTPSTPPSQTPVLSSIDPRAFSGGKPLTSPSPLKAPHRALFTSFGPLLNALTILKSNLCLLSQQIAVAERTQSNTVAEGDLREVSSTALEVDVRVESAVHRPDWIGSPTQSDVNGAGTEGYKYFKYSVIICICFCIYPRIYYEIFRNFLICTSSN
jgi:hypothetical protein